jgi:hypothetical protein
MQKSLFTEGTLIRKTTFVRLQMIMHRVLVLLNNVTLWANIVSIRILRVRIGHSSHVGGGSTSSIFIPAHHVNTL